MGVPEIRGSKAFGIALLLSTGVSFGTIPLWVTWMSRDGVTVWAQQATRLAIPVLLAAIFVLPFAPRSLRIESRRQFRLLALNGLLLLACNVTYIGSIALGTLPTKAVLLNYMAPVYVAILGAILLGEKLTTRKLVAILLGLTGTATLLQAWNVRGLLSFQPGDYLAVATGLIYAVLVIFGRWSGIRGEAHPLKFSFWTFTFALAWLIALGLIVLAALGPDPVATQIPGSLSPRTVASIVGLAVLGTGLPFTLMYLGLRHTEAGTASILLLSEPASVFVFSFAFLGQPIGLEQIVGGVLVLSAGVLASR